MGATPMFPDGVLLIRPFLKSGPAAMRVLFISIGLKEPCISLLIPFIIFVKILTTFSYRIHLFLIKSL